ncbi:hypothetical protein DPEC_G00106700 [Dallia pectoralis]|uniref:Uncharacterized protein n=1 Tax=Dallia pectoralis TaxID=75939 RepID=A0ACC2GYB9_DALPE|nr:hypothetical protein DPEC_G00106700 [Dallia pectoralis]
MGPARRLPHGLLGLQPVTNSWLPMVMRQHLLPATLWHYNLPPLSTCCWLLSPSPEHPITETETIPLCPQPPHPRASHRYLLPLWPLTFSYSLHHILQFLILLLFSCPVSWLVKP